MIGDKKTVYLNYNVIYVNTIGGIKMKANTNMICDLETGVCGVPGENVEVVDFNKKIKTITLYYVTDPICSHCWAIEPTLRKFIKQYGHYFNVQTVMGGLLEKWDGDPVDAANGINGPADVVEHWREVGEHYRMPIDGSLMIDNPVQSSYPPSRVYKIIQKQISETKAFEYLRRVREALFVFNKNISEDSVLKEIVDAMGLNGESIVTESNQKTGHHLLNEDFALTSELGVRGFPTILLVNQENKGVKIIGSRPFDSYVDGLSQVLGEKPIGNEPPTLSNLLKEEQLLFAKEIEVMYGVSESELHQFIEQKLITDEYTKHDFLGERYYETLK